MTNNNNNTTDKGDTMKRELTHEETIVETNNKGQQLCRPKYGHRWSINAPHQREGWTTTLYIGGKHSIRAMWNAHYSK
jgi:hypothetical protein